VLWLSVAVRKNCQQEETHEEENSTFVDRR
jgi:hypothetical protein